MAAEARRRCGYRKVGGLYLVSGALMAPCDRLPHELSICPCCNQGIKQTRGWTWVDAAQLFGGAHTRVYDEQTVRCFCPDTCPACNPSTLGKTGLLWIGESFYPTPQDFLDEGAAMGISRRITAIPRNFKIGETWVLFAHPRAITKTGPDGEMLKVPAILCVFRPTRIEKIITETMSKDAEMMADLEKRGITPVIVPDNDKDHQGTVYDAEPELVLEVEPASEEAPAPDAFLWKN